ncbi:hypothetical protein B23_3164 [Geobacillus thermoleovorans B23]|nr:hypothetical protein B23_3164 [Geobacillus thermoleovorans B23]
MIKTGKGVCSFPVCFEHTSNIRRMRPDNRLTNAAAPSF